MHSLRTTAVAAVAVLSFATSVAQAEEHWTEIRSPHFTVITDGDLDQVDKVAEQFEEMRLVLQTRFPNFVLDPSEETVIFAVRDDVSAGLGRTWWPKGPYGYFLPNWEGNLGVVRLDKLDPTVLAPMQVGYVKSIVKENAHSKPEWLENGLSQLYGYSRFDKRQIVIGAPAGDWQMLTTAHYLPLSQMLSPQNPEPGMLALLRCSAWSRGLWSTT